MNKPDWYDDNKGWDKAGKVLEWEDLEPYLQGVLVSQHSSGIGWDDADTLAALHLLQEMRESEQFCCISLQSDYYYVWDLTYVWSKNIFHDGPHIWRKVIGSFDRLSDVIREFYALWLAGKLEDPKETMEVKGAGDTANSPTP